MITYPVSRDKRFALVRISTQEILEQGFRWRRLDGMPITDIPDDLVYLEMVDEPQPIIDTTQFKLVSRISVEIDQERVRRTWQITPLSPAEQAELAEREQAKAVYSDLKNPPASDTPTDRLRRVELVCAHLLRTHYGNSVS